MRSHFQGATRAAAAAAAAFVLLAGSPVTSRAEKGDYLGAWSVSGDLGVAVPGTDEYDNALAWRAALGYSPRPDFEFRLEYGGWESTVTQPEPSGIPAHTIASGKLSVHPIALTAQWRYALADYPATAYLLGGIGWYLVDYAMDAEARRVYEESGAVDLPDQGVDDALGWHAGIGLEYAISERVSLTGEGRYVALSPDAHGATTPGYRISGALDLDTWLLTAGVKVSF